MKHRNYLIKRAMEEADSLHNHTTEKERSFSITGCVNAYSVTKCLYGLLAGYCYNERASSLVKTCAVKAISNYLSICDQLPVLRDQDFIFRRINNSWFREGFSPAEVLLANCSENDTKLIMYIVKYGNDCSIVPESFDFFEK